MCTIIHEIQVQIPDSWIKEAPQSLPRCACCCWLKAGLFCRVQIIMGKLTVRCRSTNFYIYHLSASKFIRSVSHSSGSSGTILITLLQWKQNPQLSPWIPLIFSAILHCAPAYISKPCSSGIFAHCLCFLYHNRLWSWAWTHLSSWLKNSHVREICERL